MNRTTGTPHIVQIHGGKKNMYYPHYSRTNVLHLHSARILGKLGDFSANMGDRTVRRRTMLGSTVLLMYGTHYLLIIKLEKQGRDII